MANGRASVRRRGAHASTATQFQKNSIGVSFSGVDIESMNAALAQGIQEKVLRAAAHAGVLVFYKEMQLTVPYSKGVLYESLYHWHDDKQSTPTRQTYATGPNKQKAHHWHWVEFGNIRMAAHPFIRPAFTNKIAAAHEAAKTRISERMKELFSELRT